ncbi:MAG: ATP-binding protein [Ghiorsea sp.]
MKLNKKRCYTDTLPLYPEGLQVLRQLAEDVGAFAGIGKVRTHRIAVALDELFVNIHEHGYLGKAGEVECASYWLDNDGECEQFVMVLRDYAPALDDMTCCEGRCPSTLKDNPVPGGLGMHLIGQVTESFELVPLADGNRWKLVFNVATNEGE